jgi:small subunit ribosomal protein S4
MARYTGPTSKIARRFREPIFGPDKAWRKEIILQDNTDPTKEGRSNLNTLYSLLKNRKRSTLMVFSKAIRKPLHEGFR